jgi:hypothetical protein
MPRKPNYQFEKRQKELDRQAKKAEKLQRRRERSESGAEGDEGTVADAGEDAGGTLPNASPTPPPQG